MAISDLVTSKSSSTLINGLKVTLATPGSGLTPSTFTAMIGINQGSALQLAAPVQATLSQLANIAASNSSANTAAAAALSSLTTLHTGLGFGGTPNHAAFGDYLNQAHGHIQDARELRSSSDFMANLNYNDLGAGIKDMGSSADRGISNVLGNLPASGALMAGTGTMFKGVDLKNFGTPTGLVQSLQTNGLANATDVNQLLVKNGVDLNNLNDPIYQDQIKNTLSGIKDPTTLNVVSDQFGVNPFAGLPSYNGNDSSLYTNNAFAGAASSASSTVQGAVTQATSTASTAFGAAQAPEVGIGGLQSLATLSDPTTLSNPTDIAGITGGTKELTTHLTDLGATTLKDSSQATGLFGQIKSVSTPLHAAAFPSLGGLISGNQSLIDGLTGTGTGPKGLPCMQDFTQHLSGGPSITSFLQSVTSNATAAISALTASIANATSLFTLAGVDFTNPVKNTLGSSMNFAQNLHKFGADTSGSGIGDILHNMANTSTPYGEAIKASLVEGRNKQLLQDNGVRPLVTTPPAPAPGKVNVDFPITISRRFDRPPGSVTGSYVTVEATATGSNVWDRTWKIINGETTTKAGKPPYSVLYSGDYSTLLIASAQQSNDVTSTAPQIYAALPDMKAELEAQLSGGSPQAIG